MIVQHDKDVKVSNRADVLVRALAELMLTEQDQMFIV